MPRSSVSLSWLYHLIPLLFSLQSVDSLPVHRLCQLLIPSFLFFRSTFILDCLYSPLHLNQLVLPIFGNSQFVLTCLSASFSSFISFSFAFIASVAFRSSWRFSYVELPAFGRKAFRAACHCLPNQIMSNWIHLKGTNLLTILSHSQGLALLRLWRSRYCGNLCRHHEISNERVNTNNERMLRFLKFVVVRLSLLTKKRSRIDKEFRAGVFRH